MSWSRGRSASTRPDSTMRLPRSARFTVPVTSDSPRSRKSFRICSRSASRIFCRITCLAACASTRRRRSLLMFPKPPNPSHVRHEPGAIDVLECQMLAPTLHLQHHLAVLDSHEPTLEAAPPVAGKLQLHARVAAGEALEIREALQRPVQSGRRHFQALVVDALHRESAREMVAHAGAILDRDAMAGIDEDPE